MELLSKRELHGQNPIVTPCNKQSLSQFEMQSRKSKQDGCTLASGVFMHSAIANLVNCLVFGLTSNYRDCQMLK